MDFLRKKKDEIVVYPDNSVWRNGAPDGALTIKILGIPEERRGKEDTTQTYYYHGIIVHAWINAKAIAPKSEYMRRYREQWRKQRLFYRGILHNK